MPARMSPPEEDEAAGAGFATKALHCCPAGFVRSGAEPSGHLAGAGGGPGGVTFGSGTHLFWLGSKW